MTASPDKTQTDDFGMTPEQGKALLVFAERLWCDLERNELGGYSGINRPFFIKWKVAEYLAARLAEFEQERVRGLTGNMARFSSIIF